MQGNQSNWHCIFPRYGRAVAYRWLIIWMCGLLGWENTRPLPVCVYHFVQKKYPTGYTKGYIPAGYRDIKLSYT